jgi:hypothetical protein
MTEVFFSPGSDLFLICPESSTETHIVWRKDGKVIDPTRSAPGGHIIINSFSTLFLVDGSGFETSGNYTCYVDGIRMQETIVRFISGETRVDSGTIGKHRLSFVCLCFN